MSSMLMIRFKGKIFQEKSDQISNIWVNGISKAADFGFSYMCVIIITNEMLTQTIQIWPKWPIFHRYIIPDLFLFSQSCRHGCVQQPCCVRYIAVFVPNVDWPIMADCVPPGTHYPRVAHERENYASAFNETVGSSWLLQKSFFLFFRVWGGSLS